MLTLFLNNTLMTSNFAPPLGINPAILLKAMFKSSLSKFIRSIQNGYKGQAPLSRVGRIWPPVHNEGRFSQNLSRISWEPKVISTLPLGRRCNHLTALAGIPSVSKASKICCIVALGSGRVKKAEVTRSGVTLYTSKCSRSKADK